MEVFLQKLEVEGVQHGWLEEDKSFWRDFLEGKPKKFCLEGWRRTGEGLRVGLETALRRDGVWLREGVEERAGGVLEEQERKTRLEGLEGKVAWPVL